MNRYFLPSLLPLALLAHTACSSASAAVPPTSNQAELLVRENPNNTYGPEDANGFYGVAPASPNDVHLFLLSNPNTLGKTMVATLTPVGGDANVAMQQQARVISGGSGLSWLDPTVYEDATLNSPASWALFAYVDTNGDGICNEPVYTQPVDFTQPQGPGGRRIFLSDMQPAAGGCSNFHTAQDQNFSISIVPSAPDYAAYITFTVIDSSTKQQVGTGGQNIEPCRCMVGGHSYDVQTSGKSAGVLDTYHINTVWSDQTIAY